MSQPAPAAADLAAAPAPRREPLGLYANIAVAVPDRIAERLPAARPGVAPHVTVAHAQVDIDQYQRLRAVFAGAAASTTLTDLAPFAIGLDGVGDFRRDVSAVPAVYLRVVDPTGALARLAAALDTEFGLTRRFVFHPHVTLAWRDRDLDPAAGDAALDRVLADHARFRDQWTAARLTFQTATGTLLTPRRLTWGAARTYPIT